MQFQATPPRGTGSPPLQHTGIVKGRAQLSFEFLRGSCKWGKLARRGSSPPSLFQAERVLILYILVGDREVLVAEKQHEGDNNTEPQAYRKEHPVAWEPDQQRHNDDRCNQQTSGPLHPEGDLRKHE